MIWLVLKCFLGFLILFLGAALSLRHSIQLAHTLNIPKLLIAITLIAFGTSLPEGVVSIVAAFQQAPEIALGNVIGSNIANIGIVLGVACLISPISFDLNKLRLELTALLLSSFLLCFFLLDGFLSRFEGIVLLAFFVTFIFLLFTRKRERPQLSETPFDSISHRGRFFQISFLIFGLILLILGAKVFVDGAIQIAHYFEVPKAISVIAINNLGIFKVCAN